jgi:TRAP-type uncharacterized transport system fused permease subunit
MFVYNQSLLLMGTPRNIVIAIFTAGVGIICLAAGIIGHFIKRANTLDRIILLAAALLLIKPGWITDIIGLLCVGMVVILQLRTKLLERDRKGRSIQA